MTYGGWIRQKASVGPVRKQSLDSNEVGADTGIEMLPMAVGASWHYHHPERMESFSPGLRGTSYPGFTGPKSRYPERVASGRPGDSGGTVEMRPRASA